MHNCTTIALSPNRPNIRYAVVNASRDVAVAFSWLAESLLKERSTLSRVLVFCRSISTCTRLYKYFLSMLKSNSYEPVGSQPFTCNRLFAMYHARIDDEDKQAILESMADQNGKCRILFFTIAFGMGVDIVNIRTVIHFGPSAGVEEYLQETGRAGRDGALSNAILYFYPGCLFGHVSSEMKTYCKLDSDKCRRASLLRPFSCNKGADSNLLLHNCCDLCTQRCECGNDALHQPVNFAAHDISLPTEKEVCPVRDVSDSQRQQLRQALLKFRSSLLQNCGLSDASLYIGQDLASGMPLSLIDSIVDSCHLFESVDDLEELCAVWNYTSDIMCLIDEML